MRNKEMVKIRRKRNVIIAGIALMFILLGSLVTNKIVNVDRYNGKVKTINVEVKPLTESIKKEVKETTDKTVEEEKKEETVVKGYEVIEYKVSYTLESIDNVKGREAIITASLSNEERRYARFLPINEENVTSEIKNNGKEIEVRVKNVETNVKKEIILKIELEGAPSGYKVSPIVSVREKTEEKEKKVISEEVKVEGVSIEGTVRDKEGNIKSGVEITLCKMEEEVCVSKKVTYTKEDGRYTFSNLEEGRYKVTSDKQNEYILTSDVEEEIGKGNTVIDVEVEENRGFKANIRKYIKEIRIEENGKEKVYNYENVKKASISVRNIENAKVRVIYELVVKNTSEEAGYVKVVKEDIPEGLKYDNSYEINKEWEEDNGILYNKSLSKEKLRKGEEKKLEVGLLLEDNKEAKNYINEVSVTGEEYYKVKYIVGEKVVRELEVLESDKVENYEYEEAGYEFKGWYKDKELTEKYNFNERIGKDTIIYGKKEATGEIEKYTVTYKVENEEYDKIEEVIKESKVPKTEKAEPKKTGYKFEGWVKAGEEEIYDYERDEKVEENITFNARFKIKEYDVEYYKYNSEGNYEENAYKTGKVKYNEEIELEEGPERKYYRFKYWSEDKTNEYENNKIGDLEEGSKIKLYAVYTINQCKLTIHADGETKEIFIDSNELVQNYLNEENKKEGYTYKYYATDEEGNNAYSSVYPIGYVDDNTCDLKLYKIYEANQYEITLNSDNADEKGTEKLYERYNKGIYFDREETREYEETIELPIKEGYTFKGYYDNETKLINETGRKEEVLTNTYFTSNKEIKARWDKNKYSVEYRDLNENVLNKNEEVEYGSIVSNYEPSEVTEVTGYTFSHKWTKEKGSKNEYSLANVVTENIVLYPIYEINKYTVTLKDKEDASYEEKIKNIEYNTSIEENEKELPERNKTGYSFIGWYTNEEVEFTKDTKVTKDITVYATYTEIEYGVILHYNDGETANKIIKKPELSYGGKIEREEPTREGYTFVNWYIDEELTTEYNFNTEVKEIINIYAKWNKNRYTLTINPNGGTYKGKTENTVIEGIEYKSETEEIESPVKEGYRFSGWEVEEGIYNSISKKITMPSHNVEIKAKWEINSYTLTIDPNGGTYNGLLEETINYKAEYEMKGVEKEGYTFSGWEVEEEASAYNSETNKITMPAKNITVKANWTANLYRINLDSKEAEIKGTERLYEEYNKGIYFEEEKTTELTEENAILKPQKTGYTFKGYYKDNKEYINENGKRTSLFTNTAFKENTTLEAKYEKNSYTLTINPDGGTYEGELEERLEYKAEYEMKGVEKEGYTFIGWEVEEENVYNSETNKVTMPAKDIIVKAKWAINTYTVDFYDQDSNGNYILEPAYSHQEINYKGNITEPERPNSREGYEFKYWSKEENGTSSYDLEEKVTKNIKLYAVYKEKEYEVIYVSEEEIVGRGTKVKYKEAISSSSAPEVSKEYNEFKGWKIKENYYDFTRVIGIEDISILEEKEVVILKAEFLEIPTPTISHTPTEWTNGNVIVTIEGTEGYEIEYKEEGENSYQAYERPFEVSSNKEIYARLKKGSILGAEVEHEIKNIDKQSPSIEGEVIEASATKNSININVSSEEPEDEKGIYSGIKEITIYKVENEEEVEVNKIENINAKEYENVVTINNLESETDYTFKIKVEDNAGNIKEKAGLTGRTKPKDYVALVTEINGEVLESPIPFESVQEAIDYEECETKACTVQIMQKKDDLEQIKDLEENGITVYEGQEITLDLNGVRLKSTSTNTITNLGTFTLTDRSSEETGTIVSENNNGIENRGNLNLGEDDGEVKVNLTVKGKTYGINSTGNSFNYYDGQVMGNQAINGLVTKKAYPYNVKVSGANPEVARLEIVSDPEAEVKGVYYGKIANAAVNALDSTNKGTYEEQEVTVTNMLEFPNIVETESTYYFVEGSAGLINNNKDKDNTTAHSYIKIDLTNYDNDQVLTINAEISSEEGYDVGYATINKTPDFIDYNNATGRFMYISGEQAAQDYTYELEKGNIYYLHLGYRKDSGTTSGTDSFTINKVSLIDSESREETGMSYIKNIPVLNEEVDTIRMLKDITLSESFEVEETRAVILDLRGYKLTTAAADYVIKNDGSLKIIDSKYTDDIESAQKLYEEEQAQYDAEYEQATEEYNAEVNTQNEINTNAYKDTVNDIDKYQEIISNEENIATYDYTGEEQEYTAPEEGYYLVELWGASGGNVYNNSYLGGLGAYTSGVVKLSNNEKVYIYIGENYNNYKETSSFNGGGHGSYSSNREYNGNGGGATDIRLINGNWDESSSLASRIMVAAGGGGASYWSLGSNGGYGGTFVGGSGNYSKNNNGDNIEVATGGTQTSGGLMASKTPLTTIGTSMQGSFGQGGYGTSYTASWIYYSGGGGGYYGGGSGGSESGIVGSAAGGSSYISGHTGCVAITSETDTSPKDGCTDGTTDIECSYHYSGKIFNSTYMKAGNETMPTHDGTSTMTGNSGNGYAKITQLGTEKLNVDPLSIITASKPTSSTSNGTISSTSESTDAYKLFDGNKETTYSTDLTEEVITWNMEEENTIKSFKIYGSSDSTKYPTSVKIEGSKDGETYTVITDQQLEPKGLNEYNEIDISIDDIDSYKYYKYTFSNENGIELNEIELEQYNISREIYVGEVPVKQVAELKESTLQGNVTSTTGNVIENNEGALLYIDDAIINIDKAGTSSVYTEGISNYGTLKLTDKAIINNKVNYAYGINNKNTGEILDSPGTINVTGGAGSHAILNNSLVDDEINAFKIVLANTNNYGIIHRANHELLIDNVTISGSGNGINTNQDIIIKNSNIKGSGIGVYAYNGSKVDINENTNINMNRGVYVPEENVANIIVNGATIKGSWSGIYLHRNYGTYYNGINVSTLTINSGEVEGYYNGITLYGTDDYKNKIIINDGLVKSDNVGIGIFHGSLEMNGGHIESSGSGIGEARLDVDYFINSSSMNVDLKAGYVKHLSGSGIVLNYGSVANLSGDFYITEDSVGNGIYFGDGTNTLTMKDNVKILNSTNGIYVKQGTVSIRDNVEIHSSNNVIYNMNGTVTVGEKDGLVKTDYPKMISDNYGISNSSIVNWYDGVIVAKDNNGINSRIDDTEENYDINIEDYSENSEKEKITLWIPALNSDESNAVAKIGETKYASIQDAINALDSTEKTIELLKDIRTIYPNQVPSGKKGKLDLGGFTVKTYRGKPLITNNGVLGIEDSSENGVLTSSNNVVIENAGNIVLEDDVYVTAYGEKSIFNTETGNLKISDGTKVDCTSPGCTTIVSNSTGTVTIEGTVESLHPSENGTGIGNGNGINSSAGELIINKTGRVITRCGNAGANVIITGGKLTVNEGYLYGWSGNYWNSKDMDTIKASGNAEVIINGGTIIGDGGANSNRAIGIDSATAKMTINYGNISGPIRSAGILNIKQSEEKETKISTNYFITSGITNMYDGLIIGNSYQLMQNSGEMNISGGSITNNNTYSTSTGAYSLKNTGTLNITGGILTTKSYTFIDNTGQLTLGVPKNDVLDSDNNVIVTGDGIVSKTKPVIQSAVYGIKTTGTFNMYDGVVKGQTAMSEAPNKVEDGYEVITDSEEDYPEVKYLDRLPIAEILDSTGTRTTNQCKSTLTDPEETDYACYTLEDAISAAQNGETIKLLRDVTYTVSKESIEIPETKNVIIDMDGHNILTSGAALFKNKGSIILKQEGESQVSLTGTRNPVIENIGNFEVSGKIYMSSAATRAILNGKITEDVDGEKTLVDKGIGNLTLGEGTKVDCSVPRSVVLENTSTGTVTIEGIVESNHPNENGTGIGIGTALTSTAGEIIVNSTGKVQSWCGTTSDNMVLNGGKLTINGGYIYGWEDNYYGIDREMNAIRANGNTEIVMNGGTIIGEGGANINRAIRIASSTVQMTINYGTVTGLISNSGILNIKQSEEKETKINTNQFITSGITNMYDGLIIGNSYQLMQNSGEMNISGGSITNNNTYSTSTGAYSLKNTGTLNITGGILTTKSYTFIDNTGQLTLGVPKNDVLDSDNNVIVTGDGIVSKTKPVIQSAVYGIKTTGTFNMYDGVVKGQTAMSEAPNKVEDGYEVITDSEEDYPEVKYLDRLPIAEILDSTGTRTTNQCKSTLTDPEETDYACYTLEDAISAAQNGETIKLLRDVTYTVSKESIEIPETKNVIIDMNGHNILTSGAALFKNKGSIILKQEGESQVLLTGTRNPVIENIGNFEVSGKIYMSSAATRTILNGKITEDVDGEKTLVDKGIGNLTLGEGTKVDCSVPRSVVLENTSTGTVTIEGIVESNHPNENGTGIGIGTALTSTAGEIIVNSTGKVQSWCGTTSDNMVLNGGKLTINGGYIYGWEDNYYGIDREMNAIRANGNTEIVMNGGTIIGEGGANINRAIRIASSTVQMTINYGTVTGLISNSGILNIKQSEEKETKINTNQFITSGITNMYDGLIIGNSYQLMQNSGEMNISGGSITNNNTYSTSTGAYSLKNTGTLNITGGILTSQNYSVINSTGTLDITGGTFNAANINIITSGPAEISNIVLNTGTTGIIHNGTGEVNLNNMTISDIATGISRSGSGTLNIPKSVSIDVSDTAISNTGAGVIKLGLPVKPQIVDGYEDENGNVIYDSEVNVEMPLIKGRNYGINSTNTSAKIHFYDGQIIGGTTITGTYDWEPGYRVNTRTYSEDTTLNISTQEVSTVTIVIFKTSGVDYDSLQAAINNATDGVVQMQNDYTIDSDIIVPSGKVIYLYTNGHTLTKNPGVTISANGELYIDDVKYGSNSLLGAIRKFLNLGTTTNVRKNIIIYEMNDGSNLDSTNEYELQILEQGRYVKVDVEEVLDNVGRYNIANTSSNTKMSTINGKIYINNIPNGKYKVVDNNGKEVSFVIDEIGKISGNVKENYTSNTNSVMSKSRAELIVNIQTGQKVIKYGILLTLVGGVIALLMIIRKKKVQE